MTESTELVEWIRGIGKKRKLPSNHTLPIQNKGQMWFLEKGAINLYAHKKSEQFSDIGPLAPASTESFSYQLY